MTTGKEKAVSACDTNSSKPTTIYPDFTDKSGAVPNDLQRIAKALEQQNRLLLTVGQELTAQIERLTREVRGVATSVAASDRY